MKLRRFFTLALALVLVLSCIPFQALAATQVYYKIDLSAGVVNSRITQKNNTDCALVSVCTIEAYMYGATSAADKNTVYKAVINKNLGTTSGVPRDNAVQSWGALGYDTSTSYSLKNLYAQLEDGYPVIIHRTSSAGEHWSVVCGYTGSTSTLQESGFIVVDVGNISGYKMTLTQWRSKYSGTTLDRYAYRKNGVAITGLSGIRMALNYPEVVHPKGNAHGVYGYVASNVNLTSVQVQILNAKTGEALLNKSATPNAKSFSPYTYDAQMTFKTWPAGNYYYLVTAKNASGVTKTFKRYFTIGTSWPASAPTEPTYTLAYNANGGSGTMASKTGVKFGDAITMSANTFTRPGYKFVGWNVQRGSDSKWHAAGQGWKTAAEITANGYSKSVYTDSLSYTFNESWIRGGTGACTYTFYALWEKTADTLPNVTVYNVNPHNTGIILYWNAVEGGDIYQIYRLRSGETAWTLLKNTRSLAYKDESAVPGLKYYYKIVARNGDLKSDIKTTASVGAIRPMPVVTTLDTVTIYKTIGHATGNILYWNAVEGAKIYQVYRLVGNQWVLLKNTGSLGYKDEVAPAGVKSYYKIVARNGDIKSDIKSTASTGVVRPA